MPGDVIFLSPSIRYPGLPFITSLIYPMRSFLHRPLVFFPPSNDFLPVTGLADTAEYTAKKIIELVKKE
jgi:hypothetical protein